MTKSRKGSRRKNQPKLVHKVDVVEVVDDEIISELGDDILLSIINRLTLKEATATSVLSTRWRSLHTRISRLNFPPVLGGDSYYFGRYLPDLEKMFRKHMKMINHTLDSYEGGRVLKEFKLDLAHCLTELDLNRLLEFSLAREAEIIHIHLVNSIDTHWGLQLQELISNSPQILPGLKCLKELSLSRVHVNGVDIKVFLSNSPNLESLSLEYSHMLRNVSIVGHPKLQHVRISCSRVEFIDIENVINLVSLSFYGLLPHYHGLLPRACVVRVNNVPKLIEFNVDNQTCREVLFKLPSCIQSQLLLVRLKLERLDSFEVESFPELINVKHLEVEWNCRPRLELVHPLFRLIEACRSLEKFEMKAAQNPYIREKFVWSDPFFFGNRGVLKKCSPHLKEVKLSEYLGCPIETEVAAFVVKYAASSLQEFIVKRRYDSSKSAQWIANDNALLRSRFLQITPKTVNLVII